MVRLDRCAGWVVGCYVTEGTGGHPGWDRKRWRPGRECCVAEALGACAKVGGEDFVAGVDEWSSRSSGCRGQIRGKGQGSKNLG